MASTSTISLLGWEFRRKPEQKLEQSFIPKNSDDGAVQVAASAGVMATYLDLDGSVRSEAELVTRYRDMALQPEIDAAVEEIINEMVDVSEDSLVSIKLDQIKELSDPIKKKMTEEFGYLVALLDFNRKAYEIIRRWYVDGRLYYHAMINDKDTSQGILEIRYIDPRKIRKIREIVKKKVEGQPQTDVVIPVVRNEYFIYNDRGFANVGANRTMANGAASGLKIAKDTIVYVISGVTDSNGTMVLSNLHKAIKPMNQLRAIEDSLIIYRLVRAPERRIWYIDIGNLPKMKAEQYVQEIMVKHRNRLAYDPATGQIKDSRKFMTMTEDYWLPRREGGRGTEVDTLQGGQNLSQMDDVLYFQKYLYSCLNVPVNRLNPDALFTIGRDTEVGRDEVKFSKFVTRLRGRFSEVFLQLLKKQVVLKNIMTIEEFEKIENQIKFDYARDNHFTELKDQEILGSRIQLYQAAEDGMLLGRVWSHEWARKNILKQTEEEIEEQDKLIDEEIGKMNAKAGDDAFDVGDGSGGGEKPLKPGQKKPAAMKPTKADNAANDSESDGTIAKFRQAKIQYEQLKKKGANRSPQEESEFKKVTQVVAKNRG